MCYSFLGTCGTFENVLGRLRNVSERFRNVQGRLGTFLARASLGPVSCDLSTPQVSLRIDRLDFARMLPDANQYAHILQNTEIKYILVDLNMKEGIEDSGKAWIDALTRSQFFRELWNEDSLFVFENLPI